MVITINFNSEQLDEIDKKYVFDSIDKEFPIEEGKRFLYKDIVFVITDCLYDLSSFTYIVMAIDYNKYLRLGGRV